MTQVVFICGCPRSGTTALWRLLNAHRKICISNERYSRRLSHTKSFDDSIFDADRFFGPLEPEDTFLKVMPERITAKKPYYDECEIVGDKVPALEKRYRQVTECIPGSKFIYIVRNIFDVAASYNTRARNADDKNWKDDRDYLKAIEEWNESLQLTCKYYDKIPICIVDYDKVFYERAALDPVFSFLGLEITEDVEPKEDVFSRLIGKPSEPSEQSKSSRPLDTISSMIRKIVEPYIVPEADPRLEQYISSVDMAITDQMRAILHHRDFQALEATWRGVWDLVTGLELDEDLELYLLDVTKQELFLEFSAHMTDLSAGGLYRQVADKGIGALDGGSWSVIVGHYDFEYSEQDINLLAGLGLLSSHVGAPFLANANPFLIGCKSFAEYLEPSEWVSDLPLFNKLRKTTGMKPFAASVTIQPPKSK